ncbi:Sec-independent protein translocase subunit TatA [Nocardioides terrisoli]|uniref:Sec-independent protein translocase subunit TatA n=1 Tax=Nocardioides terrisoli TaxID=3388267 RepID=UPI00287B7744|nr:Sec-independent protein translocase subunit TatA [Nocardioides marmorisolisilvae]
MIPLIGSLGTPELLIILAVLVLLFGASKLPDLARGSGRAIRIFKAETKGLLDDDDKPSAQKHEIDPGTEQTGERTEGERRSHPTD